MTQLEKKLLKEYYESICVPGGPKFETLNDLQLDMFRNTLGFSFFRFGKACEKFSKETKEAFRKLNIKPE